jgi:MFS family permease
MRGLLRVVSRAPCACSLAADRGPLADNVVASRHMARRLITVDHMQVARATAPLRHRDFRLVWSGQTISLAGDAFHAVALAWLVLELTGSAAALGGVLAARAAASTALLLVGGAVVDRLSPRALMIASATARCALVTALTVVVAGGHATIWQVLAVEVAFGAADAFSLPAEGSIAPTLVPSHHLEAASALSSVSDNLSRLAGPVVAGAVVAGFGVAPALGVDAASFAGAALLVAAARPAVGAPVHGSTAGLVVDVRVGVRHVLRAPPLRAMLVLYAAGAVGLGGPYLVGLPALSTGRYGAGALTLGVLYGAWGLGQLAGNLQAGMTAGPARPAARIGVLVITCGVAWALIAIAPIPVVAVVLIVVAGAADGVAEVIAPAWVQREADPPLLGRVMSALEAVRMVALPPSLLVFGLLASSATWAVFAAGGVIYGLSAIAPLRTLQRAASDRRAAAEP